jgi:hypothetical protein
MEIIGKALEKDRNLRYQHASEICADLRRLKRDVDSHAARRTKAHLSRLNPASRHNAQALPSHRQEARVQYRWPLYLDENCGSRLLLELS